MNSGERLDEGLINTVGVGGWVLGWHGSEEWDESVMGEEGGLTSC